MRERGKGDRERAISRYSQLAASLSTSFALFFRSSFVRSISATPPRPPPPPIYLGDGGEANIPIHQHVFTYFVPRHVAGFCPLKIDLTSESDVLYVIRVY